MTLNVLSTISAIRSALANPAGNPETIGLLARALRWQPEFDDEDRAALNDLAEFVMGKRGEGFWDVERAVYEVLCTHAAPMHLPLLLKAYHLRTVHADDRRRLALQGLSRLGGLAGESAALDTLAAALSHNKPDTRGWAAGFIADAYFALRRPLPKEVAARLRQMAESDPSQDVRAEAARILQDGHRDGI